MRIWRFNLDYIATRPGWPANLSRIYMTLTYVPNGKTFVAWVDVCKLSEEWDRMVRHCEIAYEHAWGVLHKEAARAGYLP